MKKNERPLITNPEQLPIVLETKDVMSLMRCSNPTALEIIKQGYKEKLFPVLYSGNRPKINRDGFLEYLRTSHMAG